MVPEPLTQTEAQSTKLEAELRALVRDPNYWVSRNIQERTRELVEQIYGATPPSAA